uniref:Uncharacterized protein n=1 Tax=Arundo donax TaxID=35708 RepID=A0A0A9CG33_ARUDO
MEAKRRVGGRTRAMGATAGERKWHSTEVRALAADLRWRQEPRPPDDPVGP